VNNDTTSTCTLLLAMCGNNDTSNLSAPPKPRESITHKTLSVFLFVNNGQPSN